MWVVYALQLSGNAGTVEGGLTPIHQLGSSTIHILTITADRAKILSWCSLALLITVPLLCRTRGVLSARVGKIGLK
jgi:hypothetical protein